MKFIFVKYSLPLACLSLLLSVGLQALGAVESPPQRRQRILFSGRYYYKDYSATITCTLRPKGDSGHEYTSYWYADYRSPKGPSPQRYIGTMTLDLVAGTLTGNAHRGTTNSKGGQKITGTVKGVAPNLELNIKYSKNEKERVELKQFSPPLENKSLLCTIESIALEEGRLTVNVINRDEKPVPPKPPAADEKEKTPDAPESVSIDPDTPFMANNLPISLKHLRVKQQVFIRGFECISEGFIARQIDISQPVVYVGVVNKVDPAAQTVTVTIRNRNKRNAEDQTLTVLINDDVYLKTGSRKGTIQDLVVDQTITVLAFDTEGLVVVALESSRIPFRPQTSAGSASAASAAQIGAKELNVWVQKLLEALKTNLTQGGAVEFTLTSMKQKAVIKKVDAKGEMQLKCPGGQITWPYAQLTLEEKKNVAVALAEAGGAAEHCLAGFFLLATGQREVGAQHLIKGGPGAAEVNALFK